jgi:hypothetical protein
LRRLALIGRAGERGVVTVSPNASYISILSGCTALSLPFLEPPIGVGLSYLNGDPGVVIGSAESIFVDVLVLAEVGFRTLGTPVPGD